MQDFRTPSDLEELLDYLRNPGSHVSHRETAHSKKTQFVLSMIGQLYVRQYRLVQFLRKNVMLLTRMTFAGSRQSTHQIVYVLDENFLCNHRDQRLRLFSQARSIIDSLPMQGRFSVLVLYCKNASYSQLSEDDLAAEMAPIVNHLKHHRFYADQEGRRPLSSKEIGTKLHSLVEKYILGAGSIRSPQFLESLTRHKLKYNLNTVTHTINFIIAKEMLEGGYEVIGTEKLYMVKTDPINFNRLDLLLRRKDKVLVIDWKFSRCSAREYIKSYRYKVHNYLRIAKKQYDCEVEFHLYCIHLHQNGFMYNFSAKTEFLPIQEVTVADFSEPQPAQPSEEQPFLSDEEDLQVVIAKPQQPKASYYVIDD